MTVAHAVPAGRTPIRTQLPARKSEATRNIDGDRRRTTSTAMKSPIRVLIVDAKAMVRGALIALLASEPDIEVVSELNASDNLVAEAKQVRPDVAVIDLGSIHADSLAAAKVLRAQCPSCQVMILANTAQPKVLRAAIEAELRGFVVTDAPPGQFAESIRRLSAGQFAIDSSLASKALANSNDPLTDRQREVLEVAAEGSSVAEIASKLCLSNGTVRNYLSATIAKLDARNRVDAIRIARNAGWI